MPIVRAISGLARVTKLLPGGNMARSAPVSVAGMLLLEINGNRVQVFPPSLVALVSSAPHTACVAPLTHRTFSTSHSPGGATHARP